MSELFKQKCLMCMMKLIFIGHPFIVQVEICFYLHLCIPQLTWPDKESIPSVSSISRSLTRITLIKTVLTFVGIFPNRQSWNSNLLAKGLFHSLIKLCLSYSFYVLTLPKHICFLTPFQQNVRSLVKLDFSATNTLGSVVWTNFCTDFLLYRVFKFQPALEISRSPIKI